MLLTNNCIFFNYTIKHQLNVMYHTRSDLLGLWSVFIIRTDHGPQHQARQTPRPNAHRGQHHRGGQDQHARGPNNIRTVISAEDTSQRPSHRRTKQHAPAHSAEDTSQRVRTRKSQEQVSNYVSIFPDPAASPR